MNENPYEVAANDNISAADCLNNAMYMAASAYGAAAATAVPACA